MGVLKKFNRKEKEFRAGKMMAIKDLTQHLYKQVMKGKLIMLAKEIETKLKEDEKDFGFDFEVMDYVLIHMGENLLDHEEFFDKLSKIVFTDGEEDGVHINREMFDDFSNYVMEHIGIEEIYPVVAKYDKKRDKMENLVEGNRILTSVTTGERHELSKEGEVEC